MNSSIVRYILGHVLKIEAALMVIPVIVGVIYREKAISAFLITIALCAVCGILMTIKKPANTVFYLEGGLHYNCTQLDSYEYIWLSAFFYKRGKYLHSQMRF